MVMVSQVLQINYPAAVCCSCSRGGTADHGRLTRRGGAALVGDFEALVGSQATGVILKLRQVRWINCTQNIGMSARRSSGMGGRRPPGRCDHRI